MKHVIRNWASHQYSDASQPDHQNIHMFTCSQGDSQNATFSFEESWIGLDQANGKSIGRQWEANRKANLVRIGVVQRRD